MIGMIWRPKKLTREQMKERRMEGGLLLEEGKLPKAEIAWQLSITRGSVTVWAEAGGLRQLRQRKSSGRKSKLTAEVKKKLRRFLDRDALCERIAQEGI